MIFTTLRRTTQPLGYPQSPSLSEELDRLFNNAFQNSAQESQRSPSGNARPALNLYENKEGLVVQVDLPGLKKEDVAISLQEDVLTVSGERKQEAQPESTTWNRREVWAGAFQRRVNLPHSVDADKITASYINGILTITLPKAEEAKLKRIPVEIK